MRPIEPNRQMKARMEVVRRFLATHGPTSMREIADWSGWAVRDVKDVVEALVDTAEVVCASIDGSPETRYVRMDDVPEIESAPPVEPFVSILDCFDPLVRTHKTCLAQRYGYGSSIPAYYSYILVDGELLGAMKVHYKVKILWVKELFLDEEILADEPLMRRVFDEEDEA